MTRQDLLRIQGIGPKSLQVCERLLGRPLPVEQPAAEIRYWLSRGLQHRSARALVRAGISSLPDLAGTSREELQSLGGVGSHVIARLEELLGCALPLRSQYWMELGLSPILSRKLVHARIYSGRLVTNRILSIERLRRLGYPGLRRLGYSFYEIDSLFEVLEKRE